MILRNFISLRAFTVYMENSLQFEISLRSNWLKWNLHQREFHYARSHVSADNEVTSHQSEILPWSEISNQFDFTLGLMLTLAKISFANSCTWKWAIPEKKLNRLRIYFFEKIPWDFSFFYFTPGNSRQNSSTPGYSTKLC